MTSLIPNPRQAGILATVRELGSVSVEALADRFDVTLQTVRRDVTLLADAGLLARFHGGVRLPASTTENIAYRQRQRLNEDAKRAIAQAVAAQVPEGCSLILNIGTTAEAIALALLQHRGLRVITNNLNVAAILSDAPGCEVTVAGGQVRSRDRGIIGETTVEFISQFRVDIGVIGISGIESDGSLRDFDVREVKVAQAIMRASRQVWLAADHSKFDRPAMVALGHLEQVHRLFTDQPPPPHFQDPARLGRRGLACPDGPFSPRTPMTYLLALDQGTSSSRSIVFDERGRIVAQAQRELPQIYPQPGWVEHDPLEIWQHAARHGARGPGAGRHRRGSSVRALGITNQRETTVLWNRHTGRAMHHAIVWQDRRAEPLCAQLRDQGHAERHPGQATGLLVDAYFSGSKIRWILDHVPGRPCDGRTPMANSPSAPWTAGCCGSFPAAGCTPPTSATPRAPCSSTCAATPGTKSLLALLDVPASPATRGAPEQPPLCRERCPTCSAPSLPIAGIAGDQQSALFGQACFSRRPGQEHLRHRLLHADAHRWPVPAPATTA
jgi:DeoR family glycerol-3-phosphate regulon repressor